MNHKKIIIMICFSIMTGIFCSCGKMQNEKTEPSDTSSINMEDGTFHFEMIESNIYIKGYRFTVPQKLSELEEGLTYKFIGEEFDDGLYEVEISDENGIILRSLADNAHHKNGKAFLYNIAVEDSESNVAGMIPHMTTKEEVVKKFGEPDEIVSSYSDENKKIYKYGTYEVKNCYRSIGKFMTISFDTDGIVELIVVNSVSS